MSNNKEKSEEQSIKNYRQEMVERMLRAVPEDGSLDPFPSLRVSRSSKVRESEHSVFHPSLCFVVQGSKHTLLGEEVFQYNPGNYLIFTVDLPMVFRIEEASAEKPYLGFRLHLEPALVASVLMESSGKIKKAKENTKAINVSPFDLNLLDALVRLIRLLESPNDYKILAPLITKEIIYRLLMGGQAERLSHLVSSAGDTRRISKAIGHLRKHYDEPLRIETIARELGMSVSGFHHHFKSVTSISPLQFQKQLRLQEARRLMLGEDLDAANAGFRVGYDDPAYFSRDYKKLFGAPPLRDIAKIRSNFEH